MESHHRAGIHVCTMYNSFTISAACHVFSTPPTSFIFLLHAPYFSSLLFDGFFCHPFRPLAMWTLCLYSFDFAANETATSKTFFRHFWHRLAPVPVTVTPSLSLSLSLSLSSSLCMWSSSNKAKPWHCSELHCHKRY